MGWGEGGPGSRCRRRRHPAPCRTPCRPPCRGACRLAHPRPRPVAGSGCARPSRSARARPSGCTCSRRPPRASRTAVLQRPRCLRHVAVPGRFQRPCRFRHGPRSGLGLRPRASRNESRSNRLRPAAPQARRCPAALLPTHLVGGRRLRRRRRGRSRRGRRQSRLARPGR